MRDIQGRTTHMNYRMKYLRLGMAVVLCCILSFNILAQEVFFEQYTEVDGLPSMTTYEMAQDSAGILWVGTENGLVSFDGEKFRTYTHPDLKDNDIIELEISKDGAVLFTNLSNQLMKLVDGEIIFLHNFETTYFYELVSTAKNDFILEYSRIQSNRNSVYEIIYSDSIILKKIAYSTFDYQAQLISGEATKRSVIGNYITAWERDNDVTFYNSREHFFITDDTSYNFKDIDADTITLTYKIFQIKCDSQFAIVNYSRQYIPIDSIEDKTFDLHKYRDIVVHNNLYFGVSNNGLDLYDVRVKKKQNLISEMYINTVFVDREQNIWVSTRDNGLIRISSIYISLFRPKKEDKDISILHSYFDNVVIIKNDNVDIYNTTTKKTWSKDFQTSEKCYLALDDDDLVISSLNKHITYNHNTKIGIEETNIFSAKYSTIVDSIIYFGSSNGLYYRSWDNALSDMNRDNFFTVFEDKRVLTIEHCSINQKTLAGTTVGAFQIYPDQSYSTFIEELSLFNINTIVESNDKSIWIGTENNGVYQIKGDSIANVFNLENGLVSNVINDIILMDNFVFVATINGISRIDVNTLEVVSKNKVNGLLANNISSLCLSEGKILASIRNKILALDNSFFESKNIPPVLSFGEIYKNNEKVQYLDKMKFNYNENKIDIILNNVSLSPVSNRFIRYRIPNLDTIWTNSKESIIRLPALKPGKYNVEAIGVNAVGAESDALNLAFEIKPPWWNTILAKVLGVVLLLLIGNSIIRYRSERVRKEEALKRDYLGQINKIKDQALQLQMNPHFIFNSLNAIQGFIGTDEEEKAMNYLARFARLIRLIFEHSKGNTITLEEEFEFINLYLDLEKLRFKDKVNIKITIEDEIHINKDIINLPPLLIQPIIENSFKHGLFHKKGQGNLHVDYALKGKILQVTIKDDGIGREQSMKINLKNTEKSISSGIKTTKERIDILNFGKKNKQNCIQIEDLYHEDGSAAGTKTILQLTYAQ